MILVTGSSGLVGRSLCEQLQQAGLAVRNFDLKRSSGEDVCDTDAVARAVLGVSGIVHLAAVSRVVYGERDPVHCRKTNVGGLQNVVDAALRQRGARPWLIFVSSREVYGDAARLPVQEDTPFQALNNYARTKVDGEALVNAARDAGLCANICRLSTVYGSTNDYVDRVLPAFCRAAAAGGEIRVEGHDVTLDPTHIDDVALGLRLLVEKTASDHRLPPIYFVSGRGLTLTELARLAVAAGDPATKIAIQPPRQYDVSKFIGDPGRARALLGWEAKIGVEAGIANFVRQFAG